MSASKNKIVPNLLLGLSFVIASGFSPGIHAQDIAPKVDEYMNAAVRVHRFSGTILLARDGRPVVNRGYGMANFELNVANTPKTKFRIGSMTKQFTAMSVLILQERGKLSVTDSICKYIPQCPQLWQEITIQQLMTHTSGIHEYLGCASFNNAPCHYPSSSSSKLLRPTRLISRQAQSSAIAIPATTSRVASLSAHRAKLTKHSCKRISLSRSACQILVMMILIRCCQIAPPVTRWKWAVKS